MDVPAIKWFTNNPHSGSVSVTNLAGVLGDCRIDSATSKYGVLPCLVAGGPAGQETWWRGAIGREWMAIRDMDVAAAVIGIRPMYAKLSAFAVSSFIVGMAGAPRAFVHLGVWEPAAFSAWKCRSAGRSW